ncbi:nucleotide exchange factor GrpE [Marinivivus vitaminiproducens]|uniref:nucleotide exchange factor GrpE n=1 Tax=Marinivivus vitaminiproducens TaxID=3035935 RepID=UPI002798231D|nr:nucleotide exchange factor GrpE [Geminicoccaceae bacterium SCSIO 64248]
MSEPKNTTNPNEQADTPATEPAASDAQTAAPDETVLDLEVEAGPADEADRIAALEAELAETKDKLLRALADHENLRRRAERDVQEARVYASTGFARDMLEIADNFGRAVASIPEEATREGGLLQTVAEGIHGTERQLQGVFERHKIAKVDPTVGDRFDHNRHQAMFEVETEQMAPGSVAQVIMPGYTIGDRLLRAAMVGVSKAPRPQVVADNDKSTGDAA